jgi:N-acyl amino acid synthase of PEP-CTERM/exosortase system
MRSGFFEACMKALRHRSFHSAYHSTFATVEADSCELKALARRLRHEIFGMNEVKAAIDEARAVDHILIHRPSGEPAGTLRVLLPNRNAPLQSFPAQALCDHSYLHSHGTIGTFCEIAQLGVVHRFRRRPGDGRFLPSYQEQDWRVQFRNGGISYLRRRIPYAPLGLLHAAFQSALSLGMLECVMVLESAHRAHFERIGIPYRMLGGEFEYQGTTQQAVMFNIKHALDHMLLENPNCWDVVAGMGALHKKANTLYLEGAPEPQYAHLPENFAPLDTAALQNS